MQLSGSNKEDGPLKETLHSLQGALDSLENAVDNHLEGCKRFHSLDNELSDIMLDRSKLAQTLDKVEARASRLEDANKEVSRRLIGAMDSIRSVLEAHK